MTREEALEILGLDADASLEDARKAYRALVKTYHPDKNTASNASVMFRIIQDAWEVIQNIAEEQRAAADIKQQQSAQEAAYEAAQRYRDEERYGYRKAEEERKKREAEEAANRKAEEERKRAEEERQRAEEIRRDKKEKKTEKVIKRFCYLGWFILTLVSALRIINDQNTVHLINIFYSISIVCLGTIGYGWLTGWLIIKCRKKWFFKKGKEDNIEVKILFRSCLAWFIFGIVCTWWGIYKSEISDLIFGLQLDDPLAPQWYDSQFNKFLLFMLYTNVIFLCTIFGPLLYTALFGCITGSIIIKTSEWFKKKRLKN